MILLYDQSPTQEQYVSRIVEFMVETMFVMLDVLKLASRPVFSFRRI
jgi:hypothetical protein